jgi:hypothetical protein
LALVLLLTGGFPPRASAQVTLGGYTFYGGEAAFADDAALVSGEVQFTCTSGGYSEAGSFVEALAGSDLFHCVDSMTMGGGIVEVLFNDNWVLNGTGVDVVLFELSRPVPRSRVDPKEVFGVSVPTEAGPSPFVYLEPVSTGLHSCGKAPPCDGIFAVEIDLSDFGLAEGEMADRLQIHVYDAGLGTGSAEVAAIGALHSAPTTVCEVAAAQEPARLTRTAVGEVRSVRIASPSERRVEVCEVVKTRKKSRTKCKKKRIYDEGGVHYPFSVRNHGLLDLVAGTLVVTARDLDLIPDVRTLGHKARKWRSLTETMRISAGSHEIAYLDEDFAIDQGVAETNNVVVTYEIPLDDRALSALADADYEFQIALEAIYEDQRGRRELHGNSSEEVAILFVAEGY